MDQYDCDKFLLALKDKQAEITLDIKRNERRLIELEAELIGTKITIENIVRERLKYNEL